jgi:hypothetical protein
MRKIIILCGLVLIVVGSILTWRALHPPLSDIEQIEANLNGLAQAIEAGRTRRLVSYLAPDFKWHSFTRDYISRNFGGFSLQWSDVELHLSGVRVQRKDGYATTNGRFTLRYRSRDSRYVETRIGNFKLFWEKRHDEWLVTGAEGGENIEP